MWISRQILVLLCIVSSLCYAGNRVVYFEPKEVMLAGVVTVLTFPGPPNYENIKKGDKAEEGAYLVLRKPIDIDEAPGVKSDINAAPIKNVQVVQLVVLNGKFWKEIKRGNVVQIEGTLSTSITGHHHARALLDVKRVKVLSKENITNSQLKVTNEDEALLKNQKN